MTFQLYAIVLFSILILITGVLWRISDITDYGQATKLYVASTSVFTLMTSLTFLKAKRFSSKSEDKKYLELIFKNFLLRLIVVIALPVLYYYSMSPSSNKFIIPYTGIYLLFTIFETYVLNRTALMRGTNGTTKTN